MPFNIKNIFKKKIAVQIPSSPILKQRPLNEEFPQRPHSQPQQDTSKSSKSGKSAKSSSSGPNAYSNIQWEGGVSWKCYGCRNLERTIFSKQNHVSSQQPVIFHNDFEELTACASGEQGCRPCRVFRRALLLRQPSIVEEQRLIKAEGKKPITASLCKKPDLMINISLDGSEEYSESAYVACTKLQSMEYQKLEYDSGKITHLIVKKWLATCEQHHRCHDLAWSRDNPSRLLHILDESTIQLEDSRNEPFLRYVALSYCWGESIASPEEKAIIVAAKTVRSNIEQRTRPFSTSTLPATIRDAIAFSKRVGIDYVWTDSLCIVQDDKADWNAEAPKMHIVYSNAMFTLCASANNKATDAIFRGREAWRTKAVSCELAKYRIVNVDEDMNVAVRQSPLAKRGWTLQEDLLSPRKLYWFNQVLYWSCNGGHFIEGIDDPGRRPTPLKSVDEKKLDASMGFLTACRMGSAEDRKQEWLTVVESYSRRILSFADDKFNAIASVAIQYHTLQLRDRIIGPDRYLAGLWYHNFAEELVWTVGTAADQRKAEWSGLQKITPSWSWTSLPGASPLAMQKRTKAEQFELSVHGLPAGRMSRNEADQAVKDGQRKFAIRVSGLFRLFMAEGSQGLMWERVASTKNSADLYDATDFLGSDIHFADSSSGLVVAVEARRPKCVGQLDYVQDAQRLNDGILERIYCLEVCEDAMLLLEEVNSGVKRYRRIGVCFEYWKGFFAEAERTEIYLQ